MPRHGAIRLLINQQLLRPNHKGCSVHVDAPDEVLGAQTVISSANADSITDLVNCFVSPSGPVNDKPCSLARRTSSVAACCSGDISAGLRLATSSSVAVIVCTLFAEQRSACQARNTAPLTVPSQLSVRRLDGSFLDGSLAHAVDERRTGKYAFVSKGLTRSSQS